MGDFEAFGFVFLGVIAALAIPIIKGFVAKEFPPRTAAVGLPPWVRKYALFFVLAILLALVALAAFKQSSPTAVLTWYQSVLIGFSSESVIEKLGKPA